MGDCQQDFQVFEENIINEHQVQQQKYKWIKYYTDADFAGDSITRRSVSGTLLKFSGGSIVWSSGKQHHGKLSSTKAKYVAATEATEETISLKCLMN